MAAPIITCPACTKKFKGKEGIEGKRIKCPLCATPFVVPGKPAPQAKAGAAAVSGEDGEIMLKEEEPGPQVQAQQQDQRTGWNPEDEDANPYDLGEFDERVRCPNCAKLMESEKAVICIYCGYNTMTREWGKTTKAMSSPIFRAAMPTALATVAGSCASLVNTTGISTSARTVNRSSTTSQPTAICPVGVCRSLLSDKTRSSTTVLATEIAMPNTMPELTD